MKKTLKTLLVLAILCVLTITLVGCGNDEGENKQNAANKENEGTTVGISRGEWQDNKYVNDFAGIKFNLPEGWEKYSDEQIAQMMNIGIEALNEDQQKLAELAQQNGVYGMVVNNPATGANVMVLIEKPILKVTPQNYLESLKQQLELVEVMNYEIGDVYTKKIGSTEYYGIDAEASISGIPMGQNYFSKAVGDYIVSILVTTTGDGQLQEIINCFE